MDVRKKKYLKNCKRQYRPNVNGITLFDSLGQALFQDIEALDISRVCVCVGGGGYDI